MPNRGDPDSHQRTNEAAASADAVGGKAKAELLRGKKQVAPSRYGVAGSDSMPKAGAGATDEQDWS